MEANGVIYAVMNNNDLNWYRHDGRNDGSFKWAFSEGKKVGVGWDVKQVFSSGDGIIYAQMPNNDLLWYRHDGRGNSSFRWFPRREKGWRRLELCSAVFGCCVAELMAAFSLRCSLTCVGSGGSSSERVRLCCKRRNQSLPQVPNVLARADPQARETDPTLGLPHARTHVRRSNRHLPFPAFPPVNPALSVADPAARCFTHRCG